MKCIIECMNIVWHCVALCGTVWLNHTMRPGSMLRMRKTLLMCLPGLADLACRLRTTIGFETYHRRLNSEIHNGNFHWTRTEPLNVAVAQRAQCYKMSKSLDGLYILIFAQDSKILIDEVVYQAHLVESCRIYVTVYTVYFDLVRMSYDLLQSFFFYFYFHCRMKCQGNPPGGWAGWAIQLRPCSRWSTKSILFRMRHCEEFKSFWAETCLDVLRRAETCLDVVRRAEICGDVLRFLRISKV